MLPQTFTSRAVAIAAAAVVGLVAAKAFARRHR